MSEQADDFAARASNEAKLEACFRERAGRWVIMPRLWRVGGPSWRSRLPAIKRRFQAEGGTLEWNHRARRSAYRYLRYVPLGRDAWTRVAQTSLPW